uniref:uncharacterized protein isoform X2 n=1 Tax=Myxine glutinosa TaxID=7769 RepID=UPI00358E26DF
MDWSACVICQDTCSEGLRCPLNVRGTDQDKVYATFLANVNAFRELNRLPVNLSFGDTLTVDDLIRNRAQWHKRCHLKFNKSSLQRAEKKRDRNDAECSGISEKRRRQRQPPQKTACIFCKHDDGELHEFRTPNAETSIRSMVRDLEDTELLSRIEGGDLVALEAKYHLACITRYRNHHRSVMKQKQDACDGSNELKRIQARVFVELVTYIENSVVDGILYFKCSALRHMYEKRLQDLGIDREMNKVHFKEKILRYFPEAQEQNDGKNIVIVFEKGMQEMLNQAMNCDYESDIMALAKAAKIIRQEIFTSERHPFDGSFTSDCEEKSVPTSLKLLVSMLLNGANLKDQESADSQRCLTISELIAFNCQKRTSTTTKSRHLTDYETPLPLYIASTSQDDKKKRKKKDDNGGKTVEEDVPPAKKRRVLRSSFDRPSVPGLTS